MFLNILNDISNDFTKLYALVAIDKELEYITINIYINFITIYIWIP